MVRRRTRRALGAFATIAGMLALSAPAQAAWTGPGTSYPNWQCGALSTLTGLRFTECAARDRNKDEDLVKSVMLVTNTSTTARAVSGSTETFAGAGRGRPWTYTDCGATVVPGRGQRWCYGLARPVESGTAIYGRGDLFQGNEHSFAYSPTPFTAPIAPPPPPSLPPTECTDCDEPPPCADCDADGYPATDDCVDDDAAIHPGSVDTPGNTLDEDCSGSDAPHPLLDAAIAFDYERRPRHMFFTRMSLHPARAGWTVRLRCSGRGCRFKTKTRTLTRTTAKLNLLPLLRRAKLRPRARLEIQVTSPGAIGQSRVYKVRADRNLTRVARCLTDDRKVVACPL